MNFIVNKMENKPRQTITEKAIVFDMDELHLHTCDESEYTELLNHDKAFQCPETVGLRNSLFRLDFPDIEYEEEVKMWGVVRPRLYEFLDFCFKHFRVVVVWSAGQHGYVHEAISQVWGKYHSPHIIFTARNCEYQCLECSSYGTKYDDECKCGGELRMVKPLEKFWNHPKWGKYMSPENTVIIDDRNSVFRKCNPRNGIQLPKFEPEVSVEGICKDDDTFERLMDFFRSEKFVDAEDVRKINLQIFGEDEVRKDD